MSGEYRNKYLDLLLAENTPRAGAAKTDETGFGSFDSTCSRGFLSPLDAEGVPCGGCPSCGQGEFWRWPKFHPRHDPQGWVCWFCSPPPEGSGPCDFCGVPEHSK
jgi:hypothetical protein